jgi:hypothetical protein
VLGEVSARFVIWLSHTVPPSAGFRRSLVY